MQIVIIGGLPCSGKSKFAERLRERCRLPLLSKDAFKESLFDRLSSGDREWSRRISGAAYEILFQQAEELVRCGVSCCVEGNFRDHGHREHFARLGRWGAEFVQVHCHAEPEVLVARFRERAYSGRRHAGHVDIASLPEMESELRTSPQRPLAVESAVIDCDTTVDWELAIDRALGQLLVKLSD